MRIRGLVAGGSPGQGSQYTHPPTSDSEQWGVDVAKSRLVPLQTGTTNRWDLSIAEDHDLQYKQKRSLVYLDPGF